MKKIFNFLVVTLFVTLAAGVTARAQNTVAQTGSSSPQLAATNPTSITTNLPANQASSLSSLPEADMLIYINPQRILNEVVPKLLPAKDVEEMRKAFDDVKKNVGIDPTKVDYIVLAVRFKKADGRSQLPAAGIHGGGERGFQRRIAHGAGANGIER